MYAIRSYYERAQLAGAADPEGAIEGAVYEGGVRFARPVFAADGQLKGVVVLSLDHRHLMEFTQHISPTEERFVIFVITSYSIHYTKLYDIVGLERRSQRLDHRCDLAAPFLFAEALQSGVG